MNYMASNFSRNFYRKPRKGYQVHPGAINRSGPKVIVRRKRP